MSLASITDWFKFEWAYMDYEGQKLSERLYQRTILLAAAVGFAVGYYFQQFSYTVGALGVGSILSAILCGIPWPTFRKHPLKWQPVRDAEENGDPADVQNDAKKTSVDAKKKKKQK